MAVSPFDHPLLSALLGDDETAKAFSVEADIAAMLQFERALAEAEAAEGVIERAAAVAILAAIDAFKPDMAALRAGVAHDGMVLPDLVRQVRSTVAAEWQARFHFGSTSQDVIDTSLVLRLKPVLADFDERLAALVALFAEIEARFGARPLMGVTRMQQAIPITVADRVSTWRRPLERHRDRLAEISGRLLIIQFGGPAGTLEKFAGKGAAVRVRLAGQLGLADAPQWHSQRDSLADLANWLSLVSGSLGKFGQDIALMALQGGEIKLAGGGGSSAMPHKQNPVAAEALVTLAQFNATQLSGMHHALVSELERSGTNWTFEWLLLPQMVVATAASLNLGKRLIGQVESLGR